MKRITWVSIGFTIFVAGLVAWWQHSPGQANAASGVPHNTVTNVTCDQNGYCWFATWGGVGVYSAADDRWASFTPGNSGLAHVYCHDVAVDGAGRVWVAHHVGNGVSMLDYKGTLFDPSDDVWVRFNQVDGLPAGYSWVQTVSIASDGSVWFGHATGASRLDYHGTPFYKEDDLWTHYDYDALDMDPGFVNAILEDEQGCRWFGSDYGLSKMCGDVAKALSWDPVPNCLNCCWSWPGYVWDLAQDQDGNIWVADGRCGSARWDGAKWTICDTNDPACGLPPDDDGADAGVRSVAVDSSNNVWFGTRERGVARLDGLDEYTLYKAGEDWLGSDWVEGIDFDHRGYGWFAAFGGAFLYIPDRQSSSTITSTEGGQVISPDRRVKANFPAGAVQQPVNVTINLDDAGRAAGQYPLYHFNLSASPPTALTKPFTLTVLYSRDAIRPAGEASLGLFIWSGDAWTLAPAAALDMAANRLSAAPSQLGTFAIVGQVERQHLPFIGKK